ncbi:MAG: hypothetical protein ACRER1_09000 [Gammaproteobacteria bacterium]
MFQRIIGLVVGVIGVFFALVIGLWTLIFLGLVAVGAAIAHALRSRGGARGKGPRRDVIEGEFTVVDDRTPGADQRAREHSDHPPAP